MPTYRYESDGTNFVFTLATEIIARSAELPQGQFPFTFHIESSRSSLVRLSDRLEGKKFVRRERPSDNRRQVLCYITKLGLDLLRELDSPVREQDNQVLHRLNESEIEELIRLLELARGEQPSTT